jgi:F-type H+-transporting ATPase subunit delta
MRWPDVADDRLGGYADALLAVAAAEGASGVVEDELFRFAEALRGSEALLATVSDRGLSLERRQAVVEDLLGSNASAITTALVSMVVGTGRGADLPAIVDEAVVRSAAGRNRALARVRSAIELTDDQKSRLAAAIKSSTGTDVEIRVVIDETVMGGLVTEIGDDVIDGSVRHRMAQLRESFT